jgi:tRNA threonylcarbamoyladenosine biosynthesis protein TsaE
VEATAPDLEAFKNQARLIAEKIHPPLLVRVTGNLGAGKTTFISEVLKAWGIAGANSPTFNLRNDYDAKGFHVIHLDFYRLKPNDSGLDLLPPDEDYSESVVFAEWPEKAQPRLFAPFARQASLAIDIRPDNSRRLKFVAPVVSDVEP